MDKFKINPVNTLGYNFIDNSKLPEGKDEYYLRDIQNRSGIEYRHLTAYEIEALVRNNNSSDDWNKILVSNSFNPALVKNCTFFGLVRIGKLEPMVLEYSDLKVLVGLYDSTIISSDIGNNVAIDNVNYLSHYIIEDECIILNVNELLTTPNAKFGNGIVKDGEPEEKRIWMEVRNENAGRKIMPFNRMLPGDAFLWSKYRSDKELLKSFERFTQTEFGTEPGYYGKIGTRTVIKNCAIIKDAWIGSYGYFKGANKIKNVTINSKYEAQTQIGEGCELVNGIVGFGCRIFYGVKAVRFVMASHSQLKYGARLLNSYLGNNATISCCEVLNSLIYPFHEQHHNNSFLCASFVMGQSNIAAGATIGSNHNSRSPDGEILAGRGFWPGLCVSLKHNSRFPTFTIIAKGDYQSELDIPLPFSLISQNTVDDSLVIMPAYWFMYNYYALARNAWKYLDRDKRLEKIQKIEFEYLAPDTVNEVFSAIDLLELYIGKALLKHLGKEFTTDKEAVKLAQKYLNESNPVVHELKVYGEGFENSKRKVEIIKAAKAWKVYKRMIVFYAIKEIHKALEEKGTIESIVSKIPAKTTLLSAWENVGGQLMTGEDMQSILKQIKTGIINCWDELHDFYKLLGQEYPQKKLVHALLALQKVTGINLKKATKEQWINLFNESVETAQWKLNGIISSREKDYTSHFRKMMYDTQEEMDEVLGSFDSNSFIISEKANYADYEKSVRKILKKIK